VTWPKPAGDSYVNWWKQEKALMVSQLPRQWRIHCLGPEDERFDTYREELRREAQQWIDRARNELLAQ